MSMSGVSPLSASPARCDEADLRRQRDYFSDAFITRRLLDAVPGIIAILNQHRQIVYANEPLLRLAGFDRLSDICGRRLGEALDCIHAAKVDGGCGSAEACQVCGAVLAVLAGLSGKEDERECRVSRMRQGRRESYDLRVKAVPLEYEGDAFTVFSLSDISDQKRRNALERAFFHDVLNVVGTIRGFAEYCREMEPEDPKEVIELVQVAAERAIEEIQSQKTLLAAEDGALQVTVEPVRCVEILQAQIAIYRHHEVARERHLRIEEADEGLVIHTDRVLLGRILGNMLKNALEAIGRGETVRCGCRRRAEGVEFRVHNPGEIPREVQMQIFQRSFSTKGPDRGLGTYAMTLLGSYLGGEISFTSNGEEGTVFRALFPDRLS